MFQNVARIKRVKGRQEIRAECWAGSQQRRHKGSVCGEDRPVESTGVGKWRDGEVNLIIGENLNNKTATHLYYFPHQGTARPSSYPQLQYDKLI